MRPLTQGSHSEVSAVRAHDRMSSLGSARQAPLGSWIIARRLYFSSQTFSQYTPMPEPKTVRVVRPWTECCGQRTGVRYR